MAIPVFPDLWILRHGETEWNRAGRLQGRLDSPLTARGERQARTQGALLRAADLPADVSVRISPASRARRSAELALEHSDRPRMIDPDLIEVGLGEWQGWTKAEVAQAHPDLDVTSDPNLWRFQGPGCETLPEITARARSVLARLDGPTVLFTHGITSRILRCLVLGLPSEQLSQLPGGQGVVHYVSRGHAQCLELDTDETQEDKTDHAQSEGHA